VDGDKEEGRRKEGRKRKEEKWKTRVLLYAVEGCPPLSLSLLGLKKRWGKSKWWKKKDASLSAAHYDGELSWATSEAVRTEENLSRVDLRVRVIQKNRRTKDQRRTRSGPSMLTLLCLTLSHNSPIFSFLSHPSVC
jgi:hypothetical protein